jgi:2-polyprenyl-3-methyl-5-hydroxy-6-metoxy-1,4-benzoquinol methylase
MKRTCEVCGSNQKEFIYQQKFLIPSKNKFHTGYDVVVCEKCGFAFADNTPNLKQIKEYYREMSKKKFYLTQNINSKKEKNSFYKKEMSQRFKQSFKNIKLFTGKKSKILDVGCYTGELMLLLRKAGYKNIVGADPSPAAIKIAKERDNLDIIESNMYDGKVSGRYDVVLLTHVLEHIPDLRMFIEAVDKKMNSGGLIYIESPDANNFFISKSVRYLPEHREPYQQFSMEHVNFFTKTSLYNLMTSLGYQLRFLESQVSVVAILASWWQKPNLVKDDQISSNLKNYISESDVLLKVVKDTLKILVKQNQSLYIWGAGGYTQRVLAQTSMKHLSIAAFIDSNPDYHGGKLDGKLIIDPEKLKSMPTYPILISTNAYRDKIMIQIKKMGLKNKVLFLEK